MSFITEVTVVENGQACAAQLARFFSDAVPIRIPVNITALRGGAVRLREAAMLEFAAAEHVVFTSTLPLEFDDKVRIEGRRRDDLADATVVAVHYHNGEKAVAAKFLHGPCAWVARP